MYGRGGRGGKVIEYSADESRKPKYVIFASGAKDEEARSVIWAHDRLNNLEG